MNNIKQNVVSPVTFVDLFAGIGGFHIGISQAARKGGFTASCELAVDINPKARATYSGYFQNTKILNDVTDPIVKDSVPDNVDILCGGFPCQPFSLAGKKLGQEDDRGTLFMDIVEILKVKKPKVVFLENVRNLLNIKNGDGKNTIEVIKEELARVGYVVDIHQYNATQFGLPTYRPRIYIVGFREDLGINPPDQKWWPKPSHEKPVTLNQYFRSLGSEWDSPESEIEKQGWPNRIGRTLRVGGVGSAIKSREWLSGKEVEEWYPMDNNKIWVNDKRTWDSYIFNEDDDGPKKPHIISVDEAKAIMGFPHDFKFPEEKFVSKSQRMKQLGNSVAVPVIEAIASKIIETLYPDKNGSNKP